MGSDALEISVAVCVAVEPNDWELDTPEVPEAEDGDVTDDVIGGRDILYRDPGYPGLVGSSRSFGCFDSSTTTRPMSGRNFGSDCTQSNPTCRHIAICSASADDASVGSIISKPLCFLYSLYACTFTNYMESWMILDQAIEA